MRRSWKAGLLMFGLLHHKVSFQPRYHLILVQLSLEIGFETNSITYLTRRFQNASYLRIGTIGDKDIDHRSFGSRINRFAIGFDKVDILLCSLIVYEGLDPFQSLRLIEKFSKLRWPRSVSDFLDGTVTTATWISCSRRQCLFYVKFSSATSLSNP